MLGIDTPEVFGTVECGGPEASAWTKEYLPVDTRVELVSDPSQTLKDQYGRLLRYVTKLSTGTDVNRKLVAKGWARLFVWQDDPFERVASYRKALRRAKGGRARHLGDVLMCATSCRRTRPDLLVSVAGHDSGRGGWDGVTR